MSNLDPKCPRIILGLDVSTKCVGVTLASVTENGEVNVLEVTHIRPKTPSKIKGTDAMFLKSKLIGDALSKYVDYRISEVIIEEPLYGSNNSGTVASLLRFNGMVAQIAYMQFGVIPKFISSYEARKFAFPQLMAVRKFNKKGAAYDASKIKKSIKNNELVLFGEYSFDCAKKFILWNFVSEMYPDIKWVYKENGELKDENFDASDSLVCVLGYVNKQKFADSKPVITTWEEVNKNDECFINYEVNFCGKIIKKKISV